MGRSPCCSKDSAINRGASTAHEDMILREYITINGAGGWRSLPVKAGLKRCGKSCRLRWLNYLRPDIKRGNISADEDELIIRLHRLLGNRWSLIARRLPGRTDNEINNYWKAQPSKRSLPHNQPLAKSNTKSNITPTGDDHILQYTPVKATAVRIPKYCNKYGGSGISDHQDFNYTGAAKNMITSKSWSELLSEELFTENDSGFIDLAIQKNSAQLGSPSMQIIDQLSPPCLPNLVDSPLLPSKHCTENKSDASESSLYFNQLQSADSDLLSCPYYSPEDLRIDEFIPRPGNNMEGLHWLREQDECFTATDDQGMERIYSNTQHHDWVNELQYF